MTKVREEFIARMGDFEPIVLAVPETYTPTDYLDETTTAAAFHLMGHHDQRTHGGHASSEEARMAQKLNDGGTLDPSNPHERRLHQAIAGWTHGGGAPPGGPTDILPEVRKAVIGSDVEGSDAYGNSHAAIFARTVAAAPPTAPTLYRGMIDVPPHRIPRPGDTFDITPSSMTSSRGVMKHFAFGDRKTSDPSGHIVTMKVAAGSRALRVDKHSGKYFAEKEHVAMGRYEVTKRKDSTTHIRVKGKRTQVPVTELEVRQVDFTDAPPTLSAKIEVGKGIGQG